MYERESELMVRGVETKQENKKTCIKMRIK